jgi:hypothetical protein
MAPGDAVADLGIAAFGFAPAMAKCRRTSAGCRLMLGEGKTSALSAPRSAGSCLGLPRLRRQALVQRRALATGARSSRFRT